MNKYKSTPIINFHPKYQPQHQNDANFVKAIADNNADEIFIFFNDSNRVGVISNRYREEIIKVAEELGFPTNIESKNYKRHWKFSTSEARELFVIEVIDYLAVTYGIVNEREVLEEVLQENL